MNYQRSPLRARLTDGDGLFPVTQLAAFLIAFLLIWCRRPDALLRAQFYAEDGAVWFSDAYHFGPWLALFAPHTGYLQTLPRLVAAITHNLPIRDVPFIMNFVGILVGALPVALLLSRRLSSLGPLSFRVTLAVAYVALPNTSELDATITEAQWHLALAASLVVLSFKPARRLWWVADCLLLAISGLSGPFCFLLLPLAFFASKADRSKWRISCLCTLFVRCAAQGTVLLAASHSRSHAPLGASLASFDRIVGGQVFLGALLGRNGIAQTTRVSTFLLVTIVTIIGTTLLAYCIVSAPRQLRLFICFSIAVFMASLTNPMVSLSRAQWEVLKGARAVHYWFFPMLAFVWALAWCFGSGTARVMRRLAGLALCVMCFGVIRDWRYPPYPDLHFSEFASALVIPPLDGSLLIVPLYPKGWELRVNKKPQSCENPPLGNLDQPADGSVIGTNLTLSGWTVGVPEVKGIDIYIDGQSKASTEPNIVRPDIDILYPESQRKGKGWNASVELGGMASGSHILSVRARNRGACDAEVARATIYRTSLAE